MYNDLAKLETVQSQLIEARDALDIDAMMRLDKAFHVGIASATHNQLLIVSMQALSAVWNAQVLRNFRYAVEEDRSILQLMVADHEAILAAIRARDAETARDAMCEHITHVSLGAS